MSRFLLVLLLFVTSSCHPGNYGAPVAAAPPGPVDLVRSLWGDYSGRCPGGYGYCSAAGQSICCPFGERCEEDSGGAYCVPRDGQHAGPAYGGTRMPGCLAEEITCSYRARITCCAPDQRCCASDAGPVCCDG